MLYKDRKTGTRMVKDREDLQGSQTMKVKNLG